MKSGDALLLPIAFALVSSAFGEAARAEALQPLPLYRQLRYDEDYRYLRDSARRTDFLDPIKYIPLTESGASYLTLGGEIRDRYEYFRNPIWGAAPQDNDGYWLHRYMLHADAQFGDSFRAFVQLKSGLETGRRGGPRPTDRDEADLHQAFFDMRVAFADTNALTLRLGR